MGTQLPHVIATVKTQPSCLQGRTHRTQAHVGQRAAQASMIFHEVQIFPAPQVDPSVHPAYLWVQEGNINGGHILCGQILTSYKLWLNEMCFLLLRWPLFITMAWKPGLSLESPDPSDVGKEATLVPPWGVCVHTSTAVPLALQGSSPWEPRGQPLW